MGKRVVDYTASTQSKRNSGSVRKGASRRYQAAWRAMEAMEDRLLLSASITSTTTTVQWGGANITVVPNQYVVSTTAGVDFAQLAAAHGLQVDSESALGTSGYYQVTETQMAPADLAVWAANLAQITSLKPNQVYQKSAISSITSLPTTLPNESIVDTLTPTTPPFTDYWNYLNTGQTLSAPAFGSAVGTAGADMKAAQAWSLTTGSNNVVVAVLDTGIDVPVFGSALVPPTDNTNDIRSNLWLNPNLKYNTGGVLTDGLVSGDINGANFTTLDAKGNIVPDGNVQDTDGHGTFIAGEIGAQGNNAYVIQAPSAAAGQYNTAVGVNWHVTILPVKIIGANGATDASVIDGLNYITQLKQIYGINIVVANISLGRYAAGSNLLNGTVQLQNAINTTCDAGIIVTVAAGNDGQNVDSYPTFPDNVSNSRLIKVAATDNKDQLASFSNYGPNTVQLGAPGVDIMSLALPITAGLTVQSGTSMASPLVAGTLALEAAANPNATPDQLVAALLNNTDPIASLQGKTTTGGRLNALKAVEAIIGIKPPGGAVDTFNASQISGWAYSPNQGSSATSVNIVIDGITTTTVVANLARTDLTTLLGSPNHAFSFSPTLSPGIHNVSVYAVDVNGVKNVLIFSGILDGTTPPFGSVDFVSDQQAFGWAFDHADGANPTSVRVDIDGVAGTPFLANVARPDLNAWLGSSDHGFVFTMPANLTIGFHRVDIYAIYAATGAAYLLGTSTVVHNTPVASSVDSITTSAIQGWAYDPDSVSTSLTMRVAIDGNASALFTANQLMSTSQLAAAPATLPTGSQNHAFTYTLPALPAGVHQVDIYALDINTGDSTLLTSRQINGILPPGGVVDAVTSQQVLGWAFSPQAGATPINVRVDVDGNVGQTILAAIPRTDLAGLLGSANHGFAYNLPILPQGKHTLSVYAIDPNTFAPALITTQTLTIPAATTGNLLPYGNVDIFTSAGVIGWAYDPNAAASPINVRVDVDGTTVATATANQSRPDLAGGNLTIGTNHGFTLNLPALSIGAHRLEVYAIDSTSNSPVLIKSGYVDATPPVGSLESLTSSTISGWAYDPGTGNNTRMRLDIDGVSGNAFTTTISRPDLGFAATTLGFSYATPPLTAGSHLVQLYVIEATSNQPVLVSSGQITAGLPAGGIVDTLNSHTISGWAFSPETPTTPVNIVIRVNGVAGAMVVANQNRSDLVGLLGSANHGFQFTFSNNVSGQQQVEVDVIDPITGQTTVLASMPLVFS